MPTSALKKLIAPAASVEINGEKQTEIQVKSSRLTELATLTLRPGKTEAEVSPLLEQLRVMLDQVTGQYGHGHYGPVTEIPGDIRNFVRSASVQVGVLFLGPGRRLEQYNDIRNVDTYQLDIDACLPDAVGKDRRARASHTHFMILSNILPHISYSLCLTMNVPEMLRLTRSIRRFVVHHRC